MFPGGSIRRSLWNATRLEWLSTSTHERLLVTIQQMFVTCLLAKTSWHYKDNEVWYRERNFSSACSYAGRGDPERSERSNFVSVLVDDAFMQNIDQLMSTNTGELLFDELVNLLCQQTGDTQEELFARTWIADIKNITVEPIETAEPITALRRWEIGTNDHLLPVLSQYAPRNTAVDLNDVLGECPSHHALPSVRRRFCRVTLYIVVRLGFFPRKPGFVVFD